MDCWCHGIWRRGEDRTGLQPCPAFVLPAIPYPREREQLPFTDLETVWLLRLRRPHPLIKSVCWDQAAAKFQCITERGLVARCFRSRVDHAGRDARVLRPRRNESPAHHG